MLDDNSPVFNLHVEWLLVLGTSSKSNKRGTWPEIIIHIVSLRVIKSYKKKVVYSRVGSDRTCSDENCHHLCRKIAVPLEQLLKLEWKTCPTQGFRSLVWLHRRRWVSCRNTMSVFTLLRCESTFVLLIGPPSPLTFQLMSLMVRNMSFWLMSVIESVPKYQSSKCSDDMVP